MRKFAKVLISLVAFSALMFSSVGPASADQPSKPSKVSTAKSGDKTTKAKSKSTKSTKKNQKSKKAKKKAKTGKSKKNGKNSKRVANFAPVVDPSPTDAPACDPDVDICEPEVDPTPIVDPTCDPMIDKLCRDDVDPTCDPAADEWCQIVVDPEPSDEPTIDPYPTPEVTSPAIDAWSVYMDALAQAQADYYAYVNQAQKDFELATADALAKRDSDIAAATSFSEIVEAVKNYRIATSDERAKLDLIYRDAGDAYNILVQKAWDTFMANGGSFPIICWDKFDGGQSVASPPAEPRDGKDKKKHKRH